MATVNGMTAEAMLAIRDGVVVSGEVNSSGNLILTKYNGATIDAGPVTASALMTIQDTPTIDLNLGGLGTQASPWVLSANLKPPIEIGANVDLNTLIETGTYVQSEKAEATLALNYPVAGNGVLEVFENSGGQQILQKYTATGDPEASAFSGGVEYTRVHHLLGSWRPWRRSSALLTQGTTTERNAIFGVPTTDAQRVALANQQPAWYNTTLGWWESYYAVKGTAGLTVKGLKSGHSPGWYPMAGSNLSVHRGMTKGFESMVANATHFPTLGGLHNNYGGFTSYYGDGVIVPYGGIYRCQFVGYFTGGTAPILAVTYAMDGSGNQLLASLGDKRSGGADSMTSLIGLVERTAGSPLTIALLSSDALNTWGTNGYNGTRMDVEYVRPPLED